MSAEMHEMVAKTAANRLELTRLGHSETQRGTG